MIIFISGGARSGKSTFAETTALSYRKENNTLYYIATAKKSDEEMAERIRIHRQLRDNKWITIEEPHIISSSLLSVNKNDVVLIDCITIWLSNVMYELSFTYDQIMEEVHRWLHFAQKNEFHLIIVSNDLNEGFPLHDPFVTAYISQLQSIHQYIVAKADQAVQAQAGIPLYWKEDS